jgi:hypothetical protein
MAQDGLTLGLLHHDRFLQAPLRPNPSPAPDQNDVSEQVSAKLQPIKPRHVTTGIAADKMKGLGHEVSLAEPSPEVQFPF